MSSINNIIDVINFICNNENIYITYKKIILREFINNYMTDDNKELNQEELENVAGGLIEFEICKIHNIPYNKYWGCPKCNPDMFKCGYCGQRFSGDFDLAQHLFVCPNRPEDIGTPLT